MRGTFTGDLPETPAVPLPAAGLLLIGGLGAMAAVSRRKKAA
ncbi:MAG: VPLPA-CTERM sorting domain-containing protein [Pseudomonadota bacterium]|nr:VPLPA-CTERM sorting domain-containing protein [Pseudomonadota bacterium]